MKKLFLISALMLMPLASFAACAISGNSCAYSIEKPPLQEKYLPDHVQELQEPDAFRPRYITPYYDELINTETGAAINTQGGQNNYNSNCQFGVCLPGKNPVSGEVGE